MEGTTPEERISQALLWLGFEEVEIGKKFSPEKFENNEKEPVVPEITYTSKDTFIPKSVAKQLIGFMEKILAYHQSVQDLKQNGEK